MTLRETAAAIAAAFPGMSVNDEGGDFIVEQAQDGLKAGCAVTLDGLTVFMGEALQSVESASEAIVWLRRIFADDIVVAAATAHGQLHYGLAPAREPFTNIRNLDPGSWAGIDHVWIESWSGALDRAVLPEPDSDWLPRRHGRWDRVDW